MRLGLHHNASGRPKEARAALEQAIALLGDVGIDSGLRELRARTTVSLAIPVFELSGLEAALGILDEARALARLIPSPSVLLLAQIQEGGLQARSGHWRAAIDSLTGVEPDGAFVGEREVCIAVLNRGLARQYLGDDVGSALDLEQAQVRARRAGLTDIQRMARHNLGCLALLQGDVPAAITMMREAEDLTPDVELATHKLDLARAMSEAGLIDEALTLLGQGLRVATRNALKNTQGELLIELARCAIIAEEPARATRYTTRAAAIFHAQGSAVWSRQATVLGALAQLVFVGVDDVVREVCAAPSPGDDAPSLVHDVALLRAEVALAEHSPDVAEPQLAVARAAPLIPLAGRLHEDLVEARLASETGSGVRRRRALRRASTRLARTSAKYSGLDSRTAVALHGRRLARVDLEAALESGRASSVHAATERWRAISGRLPPMSPSADLRIRELSTELRRRRRQFEDPAQPFLDGAELARLERAIERREREIGASDITRVADLQPVGHAELRAQLGARRAASVSFFAHAGRLRSVSTGPRTRVLDLADVHQVMTLAQQIQADLAALAVAPLPALGRAVDRSLKSALGELDRLLRPAFPDDVERLVIVPSFVMPSIPWRMVPSIHQRPLTVAPSATQWCRRSGTTAVARVVAVAGPGLARAAEEVALVGAPWPTSEIVVSEDATAGRLTAALTDTDIVHIAAHGHHHDQSPLFSSVRMFDGPVFAHDFRREGVGAAHVVLSACEVGRSQFRTGDEALGLTASLLASGARSVLSAVAPVRDDEAGALMATYHAQLSAGVDSSQALEAAGRDIPGASLFAVYGADWAVAHGRVCPERHLQRNETPFSGARPSALTALVRRPSVETAG